MTACTRRIRGIGGTSCAAPYPPRSLSALVLTETGYGKRARVDDVRKTHRGAQGVTLISLEGKKTGRVAAVELVPEDAEELMLISSAGQMVRTDLPSIPVYGRQARGVIVMRLNEGDEVAGIAVFRAGLADQRQIGENDEPTGDDGAGQGPAVS